MRSRSALLLLSSTLLAVPPAQAEDAPADVEETTDETADAEATYEPTRGETIAGMFAGTSILMEHAGSIGHDADLSPSATRVLQRTWLFTLAFAPHDSLGFAVDMGMVRELTRTDTTYARELLLDDLGIGAAYSLPSLLGDDDPFSLGVGLGVGLPTSKASRASSLIVQIEPSFSAGVTAPLLDGLTLSYGITPSPLIHRYTTYSTAVDIPCSPATGCIGGMTRDMGARNTKFELTQDLGLSISAMKERLTGSLSLSLTYGQLYDLSPSPKYAEESITNPGNHGGSPTIFSSSFIADLGFQIHPGIGVSVGIWTPGGMSPDGSYYNPLGNRFTQLYLDLVITPVDGVLAEAKRARMRPEEPVVPVK